MIRGLWGKKIGMTQVFTGEAVVPVTVVDVSGWIVTNVRTTDRDGYKAVQVGRIKDRYASKKFDINWLKKPKEYFSFVKEIKLDKEASEIDGVSIAIGKPADFLAILAEGDFVDVFGKSKGCGFAGVVRRYNFAGPPGSHGSTMGKRPGSIGSFCSQGKVIKGKKMPGHMGDRNCAVECLKVVKIDKDADVVLVKGAIPGKSGSLVFLRKEKVS